MTNAGETVGSSDGATVGPVEEPRKKPLPLWQETILLLGFALVLAIIIKSVFVQAFYIPSPSMEPQFVENDRILVQKVSYWGSASASRGDVVVFKDPGGWLDGPQPAGSRSPVTGFLERIGLYPTGGHLVKRVIGTGGDRVICCDPKGRITVNGRALDEKNYLPKGIAASEVEFDRIVPKGHLWLMGDNRPFSWDSRGHMGGPGGGFVDQDLVVGKVFSLVWPLKRAELLYRPETFEGVPVAK